MQHIIEKAMVPFRQSPNKIINKERAMMFVPKAGLDKPGLAGYNSDHFDISADSIVSLKISFLENKIDAKITDKIGNIENGIITVKATADTALSIAKGASIPLPFYSYSEFVYHFNSAQASDYNVGQNIMIVTLNVPDLWIAYKPGSYAYYSYKDDDTFVQELLQTGTVQVGFFKIAALETQKIDATEFVKFTDYATENKAGVVKTALYLGIGMRKDGYLFLNTAGKEAIQAKISSVLPLVPRFVDTIVKVGVTTNTETLTEEEKTSACEWLGAVKQLNDSHILYGRENGKEKGYIPSTSHTRAARGYIAMYFDQNTGSGSEANKPSGILLTNTPLQPYHTANKKYVDELIAQLQAQIDEIKGV